MTHDHEGETCLECALSTARLQSVYDRLPEGLQRKVRSAFWLNQVNQPAAAAYFMGLTLLTDWRLGALNFFSWSDCELHMKRFDQTHRAWLTRTEMMMGQGPERVLSPMLSRSLPEYGVRIDSLLCAVERCLSSRVPSPVACFRIRVP